MKSIFSLQQVSDSFFEDELNPVKFEVDDNKSKMSINVDGIEVAIDKHDLISMVKSIELTDRSK